MKNQGKGFMSGILVVLLAASSTFSQTTQTVRGKVLDAVSKGPLIGVNIILVQDGPAVGTSTDTDGNYRIENVPLGRQTFRITSIGYEEQLMAEYILMFIAE